MFFSGEGGRGFFLALSFDPPGVWAPHLVFDNPSRAEPGIKYFWVENQSDRNPMSFGEVITLGLHLDCPESLSSLAALGSHFLFIVFLLMVLGVGLLHYLIEMLLC